MKKLLLISLLTIFIQPNTSLCQENFSNASEALIGIFQRKNNMALEIKKYGDLKTMTSNEFEILMPKIDSMTKYCVVAEMQYLYFYDQLSSFDQVLSKKEWMAKYINYIEPYYAENNLGKITEKIVQEGWYQMAANFELTKYMNHLDKLRNETERIMKSEIVETWSFGFRGGGSIETSTEKDIEEIKKRLHTVFSEEIGDAARRGVSYKKPLTEEERKANEKAAEEMIDEIFKE